MQRKREMSSLVHLSRPNVEANDFSYDSSAIDYNHQHLSSNMSIMGQSQSQTAMAHATTSAQKLPAPNLFGSESIEINNTSSQQASSSRYTTHSHNVIAYKKHMRMAPLGNKK